MAFWGIEVKPGKPITHSCETARGRLRISQATLGIGEALRTIIVQCNVGKRRPVLLCALLPKRTESCHLDLEFEEADNVVFSVIGPRSVYLTGYYVRQNKHLNPHSDTESYGVDIENTQTDGSSYCSDDDMYEDSFIDDDELRVSPQSPVLSSKGMDEVTLETDKLKGRKGCGKQLKKKYQVTESDNDANPHESEDKDGFSPSTSKGKRALETTISDGGEKIAQVTVEMGDDRKGDGVCGSESKQNVDPLDSESRQKVDPLDNNVKLERVRKLSFDEKGTEVNNEENELPKEVETLEKIVVSNQDTVHGNDTKGTITNQNLPVINNGVDQMRSVDLVKPKKKRKERPVREKTSRIQTDNKDYNVLREDEEREVEACITKICENYLVAAPEPGSARKSKKLKNELQLVTEGIDEKCQNNPEEDIVEQGVLHPENVPEDHLVGNREYKEQQRLEETRREGIGRKCQNLPGEDEVMQEPHADSTTEDLAATNGENQEQNNIGIKYESPANDNQPDKKIKKKMKKNPGEGVIKTTDNQESMPMKYKDQSTQTSSIQRTLSNGVIIEELARGPQNGKVAAPGKKVKIYYTAMLKENMHVFDSNVDKAAFRFCLGDEKLIDGWNVGIEGMRVGDKRRLIIPPLMAFGDRGVGEIVPPNSWVVYDIELVGVRR